MFLKGGYYNYEKGHLSHSYFIANLQFSSVEFIIEAFAEDGGQLITIPNMMKEFHAVMIIV